MRIKICGITRPEDAALAAALGAHAIGLVFARSPRQVSLDQARRIVETLPPFTAVVGVFSDPDPEQVRGVVAAGVLTHLQFHGTEDARFCAAFGLPFVKAFAVTGPDALGRVRTFRREAPGALVLADGARGGCGLACDWSVARSLASEGPLVLAGGLTPDNVAEAIARVRPCGVDVSSGVEVSPGMKARSRLEAFIGACRS